MSSGAASHKGRSIKPNTNMNGEINADPNIPQDIPTEEGYPFDDRGTVKPEAIDRPSNPSESQHDGK